MDPVDIVAKAEPSWWGGDESTYALCSLSGGEAGKALVRTRDSRSIPVPHGMADELALMSPVLAVALESWRELNLELGETALVVGEGNQARLYSLAAAWCGACPVVRVGSPEGEVPGVEGWDIPDDDPESSLNGLAGKLSEAPAVAAVELSGQAVSADVLFEILPQYGRVMLSGTAGEPLTIDYYTNLHRKGLKVLARQIDPSVWIDDSGGALQQVFNLLSCTERAEAVRRAVHILP